MQFFISHRVAVLLAAQFAFLHDVKAGCGCAVCIPCAPRRICPPPVICSPPVCPEPPPCPVIIPKPCPVCVQPVARPVPVPVPSPVPEEIPEPVPFPVRINTCCTTCATPCGFGRKRRSALLNDQVPTPENFTKLEPGIDPVCGNQALQKIMEKEMTSDLTTSQLSIQKKAELELGDRYHVLCASGDFAYTAYTRDFCQHSKGDVACYAFKDLSTVILRS